MLNPRHVNHKSVSMSKEDFFYKRERITIRIQCDKSIGLSAVETQRKNAVAGGVKKDFRLSLELKDE